MTVQSMLSKRSNPQASAASQCEERTASLLSRRRKCRCVTDFYSLQARGPNDAWHHGIGIDLGTVTIFVQDKLIDPTSITHLFKVSSLGLEVLPTAGI